MAVYIDQELCKSCGMCVSLCPKKVFEITHLVNKKGYNYAAALRQEECVKCKKCEKMCPDFAIDVE